MLQPESGSTTAFEDANALAAGLRALAEGAAPFLLNALGAVAVFVIGLWIAGRLKKVVVAAMNRSGRLDQTLSGFLSSLVYYGLVALVVITTLGVFGVPTTSFAALIGAAGLAIGLALQGTLGHVASGVLMLGFRPFKVGDFVEAGGHSGTVKAITLFTTEMASPDNKQIIIPNGNVWDNPIINFGAYGTRRVDLVFGVSYSDDLNNAIAAVNAEIEREARIMRDPEPLVAIDSLGDSSVNILCRVWVQASDFFPVKWALTQGVKERFDAEGITIPFPTRQVIGSAA